jgi:nitrite reductase/ring-hydroxylating ferredoxin subunit
MGELTFLIESNRVSAGKAAKVEIDGQPYVVCNDGGTFYVADYFCPHADGPLGYGDVADGCIVCPVHRWPFDLKTGLTDPSIPSMRLKLYRTELRDGRVYADLSAPLPPKLDAFESGE